MNQRTRERGVSEHRLRRARRRAVATTLGPRGRDKAIFSEDEHEEGLTDYFEATDSGAYLLKQITFQTPDADVVARVAAAQDDRCGDGTTTTAVYAGNLLSEAGDLIERGFTLLIDDHMQTLSLGTNQMLSSANPPWGQFMAANALVTLPVLVLYILVRDHLVKGFGAGDVEG